MKNSAKVEIVKANISKKIWRKFERLPQKIQNL